MAIEHILSISLTLGVIFGFIFGYLEDGSITDGVVFGIPLGILFMLMVFVVGMAIIGPWI